MYNENVCNFIREFSEIIVNVDRFEEKMRECKSWNGFFLGSGYPEIIVYILEAKDLNPNLSWNSALKEYIKRFRNNLYISEPYLNQNSGILDGYCGIGYMLLHLSRYGVNVKRALNSINKRVKVILEKKLECAKNNIKMGKVYYSDYDAIKGLSSSLRYLLEFDSLDVFRDLINEIVLYLIEITKINDLGYPNYYVKSNKIRDPRRSERCPNGFVDFGVAHGIAGILSVLSISVLKGVKVSGIKESLLIVLNRLEQTMIADDRISYWPDILKIEDYLNNDEGSNHNKYGWCYGVSGSARAVYLAGQALQNKKYENLAINILTSLCNEIDNIEIKGYSLCHGYSSILLVLNEMYADTGIELFKETSDAIANKIVKDIKPEEILNFKKAVENEIQNNIDLLDGITGVVYSLINYSNNSKDLISNIMCIR